MRLLGLLPSLVACFYLYVAFRRIFRVNLDNPPTGWEWELAGPVILAASTACVIAATPSGKDHRVGLLADGVIGLYLAIILMALLSQSNTSFDFLRGSIKLRPLGKETAHVMWAHVLLAVLLVAIFCIGVGTVLLTS